MDSNMNLKYGLINIQSVGNKTIKIRNLISELELDVLLLSETWLQGNISDSSRIKEMKPCTHNFYHIPRKNRGGGGVGAVVSKSFSSVTIKNELVFESFEYIDLELKRKNKVLEVILLYRPPNSSKRKFIEEFSTLLEMVNDISKTIISGDFNLWMDDDKDNYVMEFKELLDAYSITNGVLSPTSISGHIIDLVIYSNDSKIVSNLEVEPDFEYCKVHRLVTFSVDMNKSKVLKVWITYRDKKNFDATEFIEESIMNMSDSTVQCEHNSNGKCVSCYTEQFKSSFARKYDSKCPIIKKQIVVRENARWFNSELLDAKRLRRKLEYKWKRTRTPQSRASYVRARNDYNALVERTKRDYYNNECKNTKDSKRLHKRLDELLGIRKEKILPDIINAENFAQFFNNKIDRIYRSFPCGGGGQVLVPYNGKKLKRFELINMCDLKRVMSKAKNTYCENDPFPVGDIINATNRESVYRIYLEIINLSISLSEFPSSEKVAFIKPTYKGKGDTNDLNSYRPISNLSYLSKLIETIISEQLWSHVREINVIPENQSAYRANHSTETTLCSIMNDMVNIVDEGKCGILIMLDLSAAFDTVVHEYLLRDLKSIGIIDEALVFLQSYLSDRKTIVEVSGAKSSEWFLTKGVPQGSVLGPMLFNIYTIELSNILKKYNVHFKLYADDTQFYFSLTTTQDTIGKVSEIMLEVKNWMQQKKLKLNDDKTECMLFGVKTSLTNYQQLQKIKIGEADIETVSKVRNLGVMIDCNLTMKDQILNTVKTCNHHLRNIAFIRKYLSEKSAKILVINHVISRLDHCNSLYNGLPNVLLKKLQNVQNRAARLVKGIKIRDRITPALIDLHWLPIKARIEFKICLLTYKTMKYGEPKYLRDCLVPNVEATSANVTTRHASDPHRLFEVSVNRMVGSRTFRYAAPRLFNRLPLDIKDSQNVIVFKKKLKTHLFSKCYDCVSKTINISYKC